MCVALIGGMDRLKSSYIYEAKKFGIELKVYSQYKRKSNRATKIGGVDAMVIFTNKVSHRAREDVVNIAKEKNIPVSMCHSCGVSTLRNYFNSLNRPLS